MRFYSTHRQAPDATFEEALFRGLAPDGGLYMPRTFPVLSPEELAALRGMTLQETGFLILREWLGESLDEGSIQAIVARALDFPVRLARVGPFDVLELFHGPTMAFKDFAIRVLAHTIDQFLKRQHRRVTVLVATSGDTGGAVAQSFGALQQVDVVILYPKGRVSRLQEEQLTRVAANVRSIEVDGSFDDCQRLVKQAFTDPDLRALNLTSANSINIGRLVPHTIYYAYVYALTGRDDLEFVVPSGNMGNVTAGLLARRMGLPLPAFVIATNANDPVVRYAQTGRFSPQPSVSTLSNAMDIGNPSNFRRILELFDHDHERLMRVVRAIRISDDATIRTIRRVHAAHGYLLDPHTAVAWAAAEQLPRGQFCPVVIATASPMKFAAEIRRATGIAIDDSREIERLQARPQNKTEVKGTYADVKGVLCRLGEG